MKIIQWRELDKTQQRQCLERPSIANNEALKSTVKNIIAGVRLKGDAEIKRLTKLYDKVDTDLMNTDMDVTVDQDIATAIDTVIRRITAYNQNVPQPQTLMSDGVKLTRIYRPIKRVGLYIPGGSAPLISTLMMLAIPAKIAGCPLKIMCTPPNAFGEIDPLLIYTAKRCGIEKIYKVGGAQAIAAMAYGTETIPKVDKIFGPGNAWVTEAKARVAQDPQGAAIDLPAGPSELVVIADQRANPTFVAADLLSQAEHGPDSQVFCLTDCSEQAERISAEVRRQLNQLKRQAIAERALINSRIILVDSIKKAIAICNDYAPEHLSLQIENPECVLAQITSAGAVFVGDYTPETLGDYVTGSNHVLPTYGYAKTYSGLQISDYFTSISVQQASYTGLKSLGDVAMTIAAIEGLDAHRLAVAVRLNDAPLQNDAAPRNDGAQFVRQDLQAFTGYQSANKRNGDIFLNANESPWDDNVEITVKNINRYPAPPIELGEKLAQRYQIDPEQLCLTRGSNEAIDYLIRLCCLPGDEIILCPPTFGMYGVCAKLQGVSIREIPLLDNFALNMPALENAQAKILFLCSPNNPTGNCIDMDDVVRLCQKFNGLVIVDEAYIEYAESKSCIREINNQDNLVILRTLSKAYGLASARIGAVISNPALITWLNKILPPYRLSSSATQVAMQVVEQSNRERIQITIQQRELLQKELKRLSIVRTIYPSEANFLLVEFQQSVEEALAKTGFIIRQSMPNACRISVGTPQQNLALIARLKEINNGY